MKKFVLAGAATLALSTAANAAIVATVAPAAVNPPQSNAGTMTGYTGYIVTLSNTTTNGAGGTGLAITGVDIKNAGGGITGPMQQRWTWDADNEVFVPTPQNAANGANATAAANLDSHILIPAANRIDTDAPAENNNVGPGFAPDVAASADYGTGSFLTMATGLTGLGNSVPLAYIIVKDGQTVNVVGQATEQSNPTPFAFAAVVGVPEPTSMGLLGLGAVGLLARRRRMA